MSELVPFVAAALVLGVAASAAMDAWGLVLRRGFGVPTLDYALLGRWIGHWPRGRFAHGRIAAAPAIPGERALGWAAHYAIGVTFAAVLLAWVGIGWVAAPTLLPALVVGLGTIVAPWLVMQPAMGAGIAGARTPNPRATRLRNLGTHMVYGLGLYAAALLVAAIVG